MLPHKNDRPTPAVSAVVKNGRHLSGKDGPARAGVATAAPAETGPDEAIPDPLARSYKAKNGARYKIPSEEPSADGPAPPQGLDPSQAEVSIPANDLENITIERNKQKASGKAPKVPQGKKQKANDQVPNRPQGKKRKANDAVPNEPQGTKQKANDEGLNEPQPKKRKANNEVPNPQRRRRKANHEVPNVPQGNNQKTNDEVPNESQGNNQKANDEVPDVPQARRSRHSQVSPPLPPTEGPYLPGKNRDVKWMQKAKRQLAASKPSRGTIHARNVKSMQDYFNYIGVPIQADTQYGYDNNVSSSEDGGMSARNEIEQPECYILSASAAKQLLDSTDEITAPVFVTDNPAWQPDDEMNMRRPIEKLFDWFTDPSGVFECVDSSLPEDHDIRVRLDETKKRFLENDDPTKPVEYPWNLPDMPHPFQSSGAPTFIQTPNTNLLVDIMRWELDVIPDHVCFSSCPGERTYEYGPCGNDSPPPSPRPPGQAPKDANVRSSKKAQRKTKPEEKRDHFITDKALASLQCDWRSWQGTVMLAEPGAITLPHADRWGYATWIRCVEGEIGLAWQSHPTRKERSGALYNQTKPAGEWKLKVLRKGDVVYMSPGTPHLVFRRTDKGQTFALAGHVLRRCDMERWLRLLDEEVVHYLADKNDHVARGDTIRGLVDGARHMLEQATRQGNGMIEIYGGEEATERAKELMLKLEEKAKKLDAKVKP